MIVGFFINVLYVAISFVVGLLPVIAFPSAVTAAITSFWGYANLFSMVIPVGTIAILLGLWATYEGIWLTWSFAHWILRRFKR